MGKKPVVPVPSLVPPEWDPSAKELWHVDFEKEPVNDDKWTCIVTAAIPAEAGDDECIQSYVQCVNTGLRKSLKVISMADVVELLKGSISFTDTQKAKPDRTKTGKADKMENMERGDFKSVVRRSSQIVGLAAKYATLMDIECKLPSDLMAAVLKYLILNLKDESCFQKRLDKVKARKIKERVLKAKFIRSLKPFEMGEDQEESFSKDLSNILELEEPINDQPFNGPDLYILLTDIYDLLCFPELVRLNVPFLALLRIADIHSKRLGKSSLTMLTSRVDTSRKSQLLAQFWETLKENCGTLEGAQRFKDIAMIGYNAPPSRHTNTRSNYLQKLFGDLAWVQYTVYDIHRQHQMYLRELYVQRLIVSLEPLQLHKCEVYSKICDILITGQPLTPALVLYAIIEQVVAGVPETESVAFEYSPEPDTLFSNKPHSGARGDDLNHFHERTMKFTTPCKQCLDKIQESPCETLSKVFSIPVKTNRMSVCEEVSDHPFQGEECLQEGTTDVFGNKKLGSKESVVCEILRKVSAERKDKDGRRDKKWKAPELCFHGDSVFIQMYHCDPRILTPETLIERFLKASQVSKIWAKYPRLSPENRAFSNFHFASLLKISNESEESLKLKISFTIAMRLLGMIKSYLYRGTEKDLSEEELFFGKEKLKSKEELKKVKFQQSRWNVKGDDTIFSDYFFKILTPDKGIRLTKMIHSKSDISLIKSSFTRQFQNTDSESLRKAVGAFSMTFASHHSSGMCMHFRPSDLTSSSDSTSDNSPNVENLFGLLDLNEISNLIEPYFLSNKDEYLQLTQSFKYYETLCPQVMIQRLLEAEENYNIAQYLYFAPTDTVVAVMYNEFDYRGVFYAHGTGVLPTPVRLRDFHNYILGTALDWSHRLEVAYQDFITSLQEELHAEEEKQEEEYLTHLKREYCEMSPEERNEFLETVVDLQSEPEVAEDELEDLPVKPKFGRPPKVYFVTTNFNDVRVECKRKVNEFFSRDGIEVNVMTDHWLYEPLSLLTLVIKRPKLRLYYHQWLGDENTNTAFTFKTASDIIFAFYKNDTQQAEDFNYNVNMSWPTGLVVQPVYSDTGLYVRQSYLAVCRSGWDIEKEKSRCYLKNGQVLVFKESGDLDILFGNGTKYVFYESGPVPRYEVISTTGEVWEVRTKGPCRFRKKLRTTQKVLIGTDPRTQETYYRREDGVNCMLWPNGRLVTTYSDGTKITSTPYFGPEVEVDWSEEEKLQLLKVESQQMGTSSSPELRSRTILRNSSAPRMSEHSTFVVEAFLSISCSYLMEHPKYSTVFFNPEDPFVTLTMPQKLKVFLKPRGNYEVRQEKHVLTVQDGVIDFSLICDVCGDRSTATLNLHNEGILCKVVDFFREAFLVLRNGKTIYEENFREFDEDDDDDDDDDEECNIPGRSEILRGQCEHTKTPSVSHRCFALNRDLSGVEFVPVNSLGYDCYELPEDTYFDLHTDEPPKVSHTFSSPYYKVGYENWVMDYEDKDNALPTNLKKRDLKELGVKDNTGNFFKYPFPKHHNCSELQLSTRSQKQVSMPKITVARIVKCLSPNPTSVIQSVKTYIELYQKRARDICAVLANQKAREELSVDQRYIKMKLKKIALTLNQSLKMYPHLCTQSPSTERDIHYFGHFIQLMDEFKHQLKSEDEGFDCKQLPKPMPRSSAFPAIHEDSELT